MSAVVVVALYVIALGLRLYAAGQLPFPATEAAAYYAGVALHLASGDGLVSDAVWSYATPPLVAPKPAFELWMPLSSLISAVGMTVGGLSWSAAQVASAILGAALAPLAWALARAAGRAGGLEDRRVTAVALASGLAAAILAPFVLNSAVPDSYTPFTVAAVAATLLIPGALGSPDRPGRPAGRRSRWAGLVLGVCLGLAYLARQEAIWLGLAVLILLLGRSRAMPPGIRLREASARLWPIVLGGLFIVTPWLLRNTLELGSPFPGQAIENLFLRRNEDIFAFSERPSAGAYLAQGPGTLFGNITAAAWAALGEVLIMPAFPVGIIGLVSLVGLWRSPVLRHPGPLQALLLGGGLTFAATAVLFPVASRWGTYLHASGPLLVGLAVTAALGTDAFMARVSRWRAWPRTNVIVGPLGLVVVAMVMSALQIDLLADQTGARQRHYQAIARSLAELGALDGSPAPAIVITDHPMWLASVTGAPALALPDEDPASVWALGREFGARQVVVVDERGRYPAALLEGAGSHCLADEPVRLGEGEDAAWLFRLAASCPA